MSMVHTEEMDNDPDLLPEYDFSGGIRGKYAARYFPDHDSVNESLRGLVAIMEKCGKAGERNGK
jgi:hypothetical protein